MKYKVIISDRARESLGLHLRFLAQASRPAAVKLKHRFLEEIRSLQEMRQSCCSFGKSTEHNAAVADGFIARNRYFSL